MMKPPHLILISLLALALFIGVVGASGGYTAHYPPEYSATYVNATTSAGTSMQPWYAVDPSNSLIDSYLYHAWVSKDYDFGGQRFTIDLGDNYIIRNVSYDNFHSSGTITDRGSNNVTVYGSSTNDSYLKEPSLVYANTTGWTKIGIVGGNETGSYFFQKHVASNVVDTHYFLLNNSIGYRYYTFQIDNNHGGTYGNKGLRRITLWTEDGYVPPPVSPIASFSSVNISAATNTTASGWEGLTPFTMQFTNTSTNPPHTSWVWNYTKLGETEPVTFNSSGYYNPIYTFTQSGNYSIKLNVTGTYGTNISTQVTWVNVSNGATTPIAKSSLSRLAIQVGSYIWRNDTSLNTPTAWCWTFQDGTFADTANGTKTYYRRGIYNVSSNVSNSAGFNLSYNIIRVV